MKWGSKIIITGIYGSGKTTLMKKLAERLSKETDRSYTCLDFDRLFNHTSKEHLTMIKVQS